MTKKRNIPLAERIPGKLFFDSFENYVQRCPNRKRTAKIKMLLSEK
jgi:hypothetical protein